MIREDRFLISRRPYAIDLGSLRTAKKDRRDGSSFYFGRINAVWFRRKQGVTVACVGTLWDFQDTEPADGTEFVTRHDDGRYGGDCDGRWDGENYWGAQKLDVIEAHLAVLRPMLANYPAIPDGYNGWWKF
ncbi:hypothetical protein HY68_36630 [Streptomyces sp. AcH 505]|uniref:hypothetical protein n=1 Tax=Streptomyces sp. AcH 505 TaxID=352211 RepID=UPI00059232D4|nr:hypothetical protein HY68_36630 [Streptomyces sp. AcH 505]